MLAKVNSEHRNHLEDARFFRHQLKAQRLQPVTIGGKLGRNLVSAFALVPLEKGLGVLYELVSDYGLSLVRPIIALASLIIINALVLWVWEAGSSAQSRYGGQSERIMDDSRFLEALSYSMFRSFPFGPWADVGRGLERPVGEQVEPADEDEFFDPMTPTNDQQRCVFASRIMAQGECRPIGILLETERALEAHRLVVRVLGLLQTFLTLVLAFLFGLAVRRRFQIS